MREPYYCPEGWELPPVLETLNDYSNTARTTSGAFTPRKVDLIWLLVREPCSPGDTLKFLGKDLLFTEIYWEIVLYNDHNMIADVPAHLADLSYQIIQRKNIYQSLKEK